MDPFAGRSRFVTCSFGPSSELRRCIDARPVSIHLLAALALPSAGQEALKQAQNVAVIGCPGSRSCRPPELLRQARGLRAPIATFQAALSSCLEARGVTGDSQGRTQAAGLKNADFGLWGRLFQTCGSTSPSRPRSEGCEAPTKLAAISNCGLMCLRAKVF